MWSTIIRFSATARGRQVIVHAVDSYTPGRWAFEIDEHVIAAGPRGFVY